MKLKRLFMPLTGLALISLASPSYAATGWSSVAAGCIPETSPATNSANRVDSSAVFGTISFKGSNSGLIRFTCPITGLRNSVTRMGVTFYDQDFRGSACLVKASLLRTNSDAFERGNTIVTFDSNTNPTVVVPEPTGRGFGFVTIPETINLNSSYYWIHLELSRSNGAPCNPLAVGVHLF